MENRNEIIEIDGLFGSGGGQIIRSAIAFSAVTKKPCRIFNIRAGRPNPGLRAQHLKSIEALASLCNAKVSGGLIGSHEVVFHPNEISAGEHVIDVGTAGSVTLVLQAALIPAVICREKSVFTISGGTHVAWSPTTGFFRHVFSEYLKQMGVMIKSETLDYGYYPKGGGKIRVSISPPVQLSPVVIPERVGEPKIEAWSNASRDLIKASVAERQIEGAEDIIQIDERNVKYISSPSTGSSITLAASFKNCFIGSSALGKRGMSALKVGAEAGTSLKELLNTSATIDEHMADQIIPYMALANGESSVIIPNLTDHIKTNIWVTERFLGKKFEIKKDGEIFEVSCRGS